MRTHPIIHEVGMRDGLQVESALVPLEKKIEWIRSLATSGVDLIQIGSFVNPERLPQMAETDELFGYFSAPEHNLPGCTLTALVLNEKGLERGLRCGTKFFCLGVSVSTTYSKKNTGMSTDEATRRILAIAETALQSGAQVQASVQNAFGCGYEGAIPDDRILTLVQQYIDHGIANISLADTAGLAHPAQVTSLFRRVMTEFPSVQFACHFHETFGLGLANSYAALQEGVTFFESSFGGLGGSPSSALKSGNVSTEDLLNLFHKMKLRLEISTQEIIRIGREAEEFFHRPLPGVTMHHQSASQS